MTLLMCSTIQIMYGSTIAHEIETTNDAITFFGREHVFFLADDDGTPGGNPAPNETHDYCLCPIDVERLARDGGYRIVEYNEPLWNGLDYRFIKV